MKLNNETKASKYKKIFFLCSILIAITALVLFLLDYSLYGLACVGVFSLWFLYFHVADYQFIRFSDENGKVVLRYYKAVRFGKPAYSSIEFPHNMFQKVYFENSVFGKMSDITIIVKTKRGIAEYPSVSLSAVSYNDRLKIQEALQKLAGY